MGTTLSTLAPAPGATRKKKRIGRGPGSGYGKTAGKGQKGQKARTGHHGAIIGFEGGQMPMQRRLPKRGFKNPFRVELHAVNLGQIAEKFTEGTVDVAALRSAGLVPKKAELVKILGDGDLAQALTVRAHRFSKSARAKIESAGGTVEVMERKQPKKTASEAVGSQTPAE